jgi:diguanylate cyclase (GGDEF)-like protein
MAAQNKSLTIAVNKKTYPYQFMNAKGEADGLMIDYWRLWAKKQKVNVSFILMDWQQTLNAVKTGQVDIHAGMAQLSSRSNDFDFSPKFFSQNSYLYVNQSITGVNNIDDLKPYTVAVVEGTSQHNTLQTKYPQLKLKLYKNRHEKYQSAINHENLVFADLQEMDDQYSNFKQLVNLYPVQKRVFLETINYGAAVKKGNTDLLTSIDQGFAKISFDERSVIERKWLGIEKDRNTLLITFLTDFAPYMALSPAGKPQGLFIDLWRLWSKKTGQAIEFIGTNSHESIAMVAEQKADIQIAYPTYNLLNQPLEKAWQLYDVKAKVFVSNTVNSVYSIQQLKNNAIGVLATAPYQQIIKQQYPYLQVRYFTTIEALIKAAELGDISAFIGPEDVLSNRLVTANLQSSFYKITQPVFHSSFFSLVHQNNDALAKIVAKGFEQIPPIQLLAIEKKWLPNHEDYYFDQQQTNIELTVSEKKWRDNHASIKVGFVKDWPPVEFLNDENQVEGINKDVLDIIAKRAEITFEYMPYDSWQSLSQALDEQVVDLAGGVALTDERLQTFGFSQKFWENPWVILHRKSLGQQNSLRSFYAKKVAIVKGYQIVNKIAKDYPQILLNVVETTQDGLLALQQGEVDGFLEPILSASELLKRESLMSLMISFADELKLDTEQNENHFMVRKDWPELVSILDKGIESISTRERQKITDKWYSIEINTGLDRNVVMRVTIQIAIVVLVIIAFIIYWNRRLYNEVNQRKQLQEQMKHMAMHDSLTGLANRTLLKEQLNNLIALHKRQQLMMAVMFIDLDGFKVVNDSYGHDIGDELLVAIAKRLKNCVRDSDTLVRFGGDEFVVVLTGLHQSKEASFIAEKIIKTLQKPFDLSIVTTCVTCSIGIAVYPDDGETDVDLVKTADSLMYQVKSSGKNNYIFNR